MPTWTPQWPKAPYTPWLRPGAKETAEAEYGKGLDRGALREGPDGTEILWAGGHWTPFKINSRGHVTAANMFARIGPGWSPGPHPDSVHGDGRGYFEKVQGRKPDPMESVDVQFNETLFRELQRAATGPGGPPPPTGREEQLDRIEAMLRQIKAKLGVTG